MRYRAARHAIVCLSGLLLAAPAARADRPLLEESALGATAAAFAGGGAGHAGGVDAVFVNPGALYISNGSQSELGMMGLSEGIAPYGLFGTRSGPYSWALGYFHDGRSGPFRAGLVAGASREVLPGASLGASARSQGGAAGFGVDADAGLLLRPRVPALAGAGPVLGLSVRNLAESGVGQKPGGYRTLRSYALSLGARREAAQVLFLTLREPDAAYEIRAEGFSAGGLSHGFSAGVRVMPKGVLGLRASLRLPQEGPATLAFGGALHLPVRGAALRVGYAFSSAGMAAGPGAPAHSLSVNLGLGLRADRQPPRVSVRADRVYLDSASPGHDRLLFRLHASDRAVPEPESPSPGPMSAAGGPRAEEAKAPGEADAGGIGELKEWSLEIFALDREGRRERPVRTFQGRDLPPRLIRWDGRDGQGAALRPGFYAYRLAAIDKAGNGSETPWQLVEVGDSQVLPVTARKGAGHPAGATGTGPLGGPGGPSVEEAGVEGGAGKGTGSESGIGAGSGNGSGAEGSTHPGKRPSETAPGDDGGSPADIFEGDDG